MDAKSWRLTLLSLTGLLYAFLVLLVTRPVLVYGCWYEGGILNAFIPDFLLTVFDWTRWLRTWFWAVTIPFAVLATVTWLGLVDRVAKPLCALVLTIILACIVVVFMVRGEVSQTSGIKKALIETP